MKKILLVSVFMVFGFSQTSLEEFKQYNSTLRIAGGTAHIPIMKIVAKQIQSVNPKLKIAIAGGGSGVGIKKVAQGLVDIGNAGRKPSVDEIKKSFEELLLSSEAFPIIFFSIIFLLLFFV